MTLRYLISCSLFVVMTPGTAPALAGQTLSDHHPAAGSNHRILGPAETARLLPASLFLRGYSLPIEPRNSGGIRFSDGMYLLAVLMDDTGHVTKDETFEASFISEVPFYMSGHKLMPGEYGLGEDDRHRFIVTDIAAHPIFAADAIHDSKVFRPRPLQILAGSSPGNYRLYLGREYVVLSRADRPVN